MRLSLSILLSCTSALLVAVGVSGEARACSQDPCESSNQFVSFEVATATVARNGVIPFLWSRGGSSYLPLDEALEHVHVEAFDEQGALVEGSLVWRDWANTIVWQPSDALATGASLTLHIVVDNEALADPDQSWANCATDIDETIELIVGDELPTMPRVEATLSTAHSFFPILDIHHLVCCDGAMPRSEFICLGENVWWNGGHCESTVQQGVLAVEWNLNWHENPEIALNYAPRFVWEQGTLYGVPGAVTLTSHSVDSFCGVFELLSLADGSVVAREEGCYGEDLVNELGRVDRDPTPGLAACSGEPYVCAVDAQGDVYDGSEWNPDRCESWPGDDDGGEDGDGGNDGGDDGGQDGIADRGCGCTSAPPVPATMTLYLLALGLVSRRRRSKTSSTVCAP